MPLHIAPRDPMDAFTIDSETRLEGWETAFAQARTHQAVMELYSEAWARWNSAARRPMPGKAGYSALTMAHRQVCLLAEAHRARSLAEIRAAAVSAAVGECVTCPFK